jgi:hypothetical protein
MRIRGMTETRRTHVITLAGGVGARRAAPAPLYELGERGMEVVSNEERVEQGIAHVTSEFAHMVKSFSRHDDGGKEDE